MNQKIKVAHIITRMDWGGSPDIVRLLCTLSDPDKFDIILVTGNSKHLSLVTQRFLKHFNNRTRYIYQLQRNINPVHDLIAFIRLYRCFRREKFDVVHTHTAKAGALGRLAARLANIPQIIHTPHGHNLYGYFGSMGSRLISLVERFLTCFTDKIMALTELEKKDFITFKVSPVNKIVVVNSGVELERFRNVATDKVKKKEEFSIGPNDIVIGMIGRLEPVKGPEYLIEAAKKVTQKVPKAKFLIVGDGSLRESLEYRCNQLGIRDKVIFTHWREDVPQILSIVDLLILPSINEAVGRILLEAGAGGIPVVATYVGGIPEVVKDNETGILVPPQSPKDLANAIYTLIQDKDKRLKMGRAAKKWVDNKFSSTRMVQKICALYRESNKSIRNEKT